jgi:hypothetical protein
MTIKISFDETNRTHCKTIVVGCYFIVLYFAKLVDALQHLS